MILLIRKLVSLCLFSMLFYAAAYAENACYSGVLSMQASTFDPLNDSCDDKLYAGSIQLQASGFCYYYAPAMLPDGAKITRVVMHAYDSGDPDFVSLNIFSINNSTGTYTALKTLTTGSYQTPGAVDVDSGPLDIQFDNINYAYGFELLISNNNSSALAYYRSLTVYYELYDCPGGVVVIPLG